MSDEEARSLGHLEKRSMNLGGNGVNQHAFWGGNYCSVGVKIKGGVGGPFVITIGERFTERGLGWTAKTVHV